MANMAYVVIRRNGERQRQRARHGGRKKAKEKNIWLALIVKHGAAAAAISAARARGIALMASASAKNVARRSAQQYHGSMAAA